MAIQISGCTVIDNSRNINAGVGTFTDLNVPPTVLAFSPTDGSTNNPLNTNIVITFNSQVTKGTGNITLRNGSAAGSVIETISVSSATVTISGAQVTINPTSNFAEGVDVYVVVDAGAFKNTFDDDSALINTYNFTTEIITLGTSYEGGFVICKTGSVRWVVAPSSSQVTRSWYARNDATTTAQQVSGCTGWFIPVNSQLQNPGYNCRVYWDSYSRTYYWSSTAINYSSANSVYFTSFGGGLRNSPKSAVLPVRAFRTVSY